MSPDKFRNGLILELCDLGRKRNWPEKQLAEIISAIAPNENLKLSLKAETLRSKVTRLKQKKTKTKKGTDAYIKFVNTPFAVSVPESANERESPRTESPSIMSRAPATASHPSSSLPSATEVQVLPCKPSTCTMTKQVNQNTHLLTKKTKQLQQIKERIKKKSEHLETLGHYAKKNVNKRDKRAQQCLLSLKAFRKTLQSKLEKEKNQSLEIISLKNRITKVIKRNKKLMMRLLLERKQKKAAQKACSKLRIRLKEHSNYIPKPTFRQQTKHLTEKISNLEVQLDKKSDEESNNTLNLKDDHGYRIETRMLINELSSLEIAQSKISPTIKSVAKWLFNCKVYPLPDRKTIQQINDEGHYIAKRYIATTLESAQNWGLNKDGTTRKRKKILDTTVTTDTGETMSLGFREVASETGNTIAEVAQDHLHELTFVSGGDATFLQRILAKLAVYMSDRASNEKKSNRVLDQWREEVLKETQEADIPEVHKFYCMAHVLLGFHKNVVEKLGEEQLKAGQMGRDKLPQFRTFRNDNIVERVALTTSEVFGPVGDFLGLRDLWEVHCATHGIKSKIASYKDNRFNGLFATSAQVLHHRKDFLYILSLRTSNKKLQSIQADLEDPLVMTFSQAVAILFIHITGPFWHLMDTGDIPYINLHSIIQPLLHYLEAAALQPHLLLRPAGPPCLSRFRGKDSEDFISFLAPLFPEHQPELESCLSAGCHGLISTIKKQLVDFLPGGCYSAPASKEDLDRTSFAHKTNLTCEHHFGDLDSSQRRRPNCTMHHHSTLQLLKRNSKNINEWYSEMLAEERLSLWKDAR